MDEDKQAKSYSYKALQWINYYFQRSQKDLNRRVNNSPFLILDASQWTTELVLTVLDETAEFQSTAFSS